MFLIFCFNYSGYFYYHLYFYKLVVIITKVGKNKSHDFIKSVGTMVHQILEKALKIIMCSSSMGLS